MEQGSGSRDVPSFAQLPSIASNFGEILQDQHIFGGTLYNVKFWWPKQSFCRLEDMRHLVFINVYAR